LLAVRSAHSILGADGRREHSVYLAAVETVVELLNSRLTMVADTVRTLRGMYSEMLWS
jgi:hypothetical protein